MSTVSFRAASFRSLTFSTLKGFVNEYLQNAAKRFYVLPLTRMAVDSSIPDTGHFRMFDDGR